MKDGQVLRGYDDRCPVHGGLEHRELDVGEQHIIIFEGCNCAVLCDGNEVAYYSQFVGAQSVAIVRKHMADAEW
jgi:hypothetical protein